jgi:hypothetical protein
MASVFKGGRRTGAIFGFLALAFFLGGIILWTVSLSHSRVLLEKVVTLPLGRITAQELGRMISSVLFFQFTAFVAWFPGAICTVLWAIMRRGSRTEGNKAVPALIKFLGTTDASVRKGAVIALGWIGPEAKEAVPELIKTLADPDADVRTAAAGALGEIGPEAKEANLELERLAEKDPMESVRQRAQDAVEKIRK